MKKFLLMSLIAIVVIFCFVGASPYSLTTRKFTASQIYCTSVVVSNLLSTVGIASNKVTITHTRDPYDTRQVFIYDWTYRTNGTLLYPTDVIRGTNSFSITYPSRSTTKISNTSGATKQIKINIWVAR